MKALMKYIAVFCIGFFFAGVTAYAAGKKLEAEVIDLLGSKVVLAAAAEDKEGRASFIKVDNDGYVICSREKKDK